jgi:hypothetical protein
MPSYTYKGNKDPKDKTSAITVAGEVVKLGETFESDPSSVERARKRFDIVEEGAAQVEVAAEDNYEAEDEVEVDFDFSPELSE